MPLTLKQQKTKKAARRILNLFGPRGLHWAKDGLAFRKCRGGRTSSGELAIKISDPRAKSWCLVGACIKLDVPNTILSEPVKQLNYYNVASFNDKDGWRPIKRFLTELATFGRINKLTRTELDELSS